MAGIVGDYYTVVGFPPRNLSGLALTVWVAVRFGSLFNPTRAENQPTTGAYMRSLLSWR
ncbi:MAG: hypothetical protein Ct9H300mP15_18450 [Gemmatimonadota bacterium]|nr:MAG: hypothetical protein Ct9H300mP15_18450 [Gemmatimonadota bacterium]